MKIFKNILILIVIASIVTFPACSGDDEPTITIDEKLAGSWSINSVRIDGSVVTGDYSGFGITLTSSGNGSNSGSYTINGGYDLLDGSGSYSIKGTSSLSITTAFGNSVSASVELSNEDKSLTFSFNNPNTTFGGGRLQGVSGEYVFELSK